MAQWHTNRLAGVPLRNRYTANLREFFAAMEAHGSEKVWVHCSANMRVSVFIGPYRVIKQGWEREPAFALMNGLWQPNEVWSSFISSLLGPPRS